MKYTDIHTHILPGVDDGPGDWEQTKRMLQLEAGEGVSKIIATPHFDLERNHVSPVQIQELVETANAFVRELSLELTVYPGCEVLFSPGVPEAYRQGKILTLAKSSYLLVEFFPRSSFREIREGVRALCMEGLIPVIAHIERYECLINEYDRLFELEKMGALMQMNGDSLFGKPWDKRVRMCRKLVRNGFIHFLGSDCHDDKEYPPRMHKVYEAVVNLCGEDMAESLMAKNAGHILEK